MDARDRILDAAEKLTVETGGLHFTLEQVAQVASVSKGGLLYHFPTKRILLHTLTERLLICGEVERRAVRLRLPDGPSADLKATVLGSLCRPRRSDNQNSALLALAADPAHIELFRNYVSDSVAELTDGEGSFESKLIVLLATEGLMAREALRISTLTADQRNAVIHKLLHLSDEACLDPAVTAALAQRAG